MNIKLPWLCYYWRSVARDAVKAATNVKPSSNGKELTATVSFSKDKFKQVMLDSGRHNRKVRKMIRGL